MVKEDLALQMENRQSIKKRLQVYSQSTRSYLALIFCLVEMIFWLWIFSCIVTAREALTQSLLSFALGILSYRLTVYAHDAGHGTLAPTTLWNQVMGRIAFLPGGIPFSLWELGHNVAHHSYPNFIKHDYIWAPQTRAEYLSLPRHRKYLERFYRTVFGAGLYYLFEIWFRRLIFPNKAYAMEYRPAFTRDTLLVLGFFLCWAGASVIIPLSAGQSPGLGFLFGFLIPWLTFAQIFSASIYLHHTHPEVAWYNDKKRWMQEQGYLKTTVHIEFPWLVGAMMLNIMEHTAHHVDMKIPLHRLPKAQKDLALALHPHVRKQKFSWNWYLKTLKTCQIYDYENQKWSSFTDES